MSVSTVTITIEEFEELITCKRKLKMIKTVHDKNNKNIEACNKSFNKHLKNGNIKACKETLKAQDIKNIFCLAKIEEVLKS